MTTIIGGTRCGKTWLADQMMKELAEKHKGKIAVIIVTKDSYEVTYPGAIQGVVIDE